MGMQACVILLHEWLGDQKARQQSLHGIVRELAVLSNTFLDLSIPDIVILLGKGW